MTTIYKILTAAQWQQAEAAGRFEGAPIDLKDGYIHFSDAGHRARDGRQAFCRPGRSPARGRRGRGARRGPANGSCRAAAPCFPHLYASLPLDRVLWIKPLPLGPDGSHLFPDELP